MEASHLSFGRITEATPEFSSSFQCFVDQFNIIQAFQNQESSVQMIAIKLNTPPGKKVTV